MATARPRRSKNSLPCAAQACRGPSPGDDRVGYLSLPVRGNYPGIPDSSLMASLVVRVVSFLEVELEVFRFHSRPRSPGGGVKSERVLVSRAARNWRPPVRRSRRHRPPPFGLPCRTRPFLRGPLLPGQPRFPFPAVACFPAPKGLRLAELGTCGERPPGEACGTLGRGPCSRPSPVCVRLLCSHV